MFKELWWLNYCYCCGQGCGRSDKPILAHESWTACIQCRQELVTDLDIMFCGHQTACICFRSICMVPPRMMPPCILCNKKPCGGEVKLPDSEQNHLGHGDTCWPCWCFCMGLNCYRTPCGSLGDEYMHVIRCDTYQLCLHGFCRFRDHGEGFHNCFSVNTCCCFWIHFDCPRPQTAPKCVCCNMGNPNRKVEPGS